MGGKGELYLLCIQTVGGGLDYGKRKCDNYCRLGSAGAERRFSACQVLFHPIYNVSVAGDKAHYALASAFCVCRKDGDLILKF